jgi:ribosomal protein S1
MNNEQIGKDVENVQNEVASMSDMESYEESFKQIRVGEYVKGKIEKIDNDGTTVDLGGKTDGFVPAAEITDFNPSESDLKVGDEINVVVLQRKGGVEGEFILSKKRADKEFAWKRILEAYEKKEPITATCTEAVKGGVIVDIGTRGFVPASQLDIRQVKDLTEFIGEELRLKIIELDPQKKRVVLSRKDVLIEEKKKAKDEIMARIKEGEIVHGEIARITKFGAFVNLGGIDGLIHISEMSWKRINDPSDIVSPGDKVDVLVLKVDLEKDKIQLSLRQAKPDPWLVADEKFPVGSIIPGKITKLAKKYAFVELMDGIEGLIPIGEISNERIGVPEDVLKIGQEVNVKVLEVKSKDRRMTLSIKATLPAPEKPARSKKKEDFAEYSDKSTATIGSYLKSKEEGNI